MSAGRLLLSPPEDSPCRSEESLQIDYVGDDDDDNDDNDRLMIQANDYGV
jgi:hypothetical protein